MSETSSHLQEFCETYPFPIAYLLEHEVIGAANPREQALGLVHLSSMALQYMALIVASNYAALPQKEPNVSHVFDRLKQPLISDFGNVSRVTVKVLSKSGNLFVPELARTIKKLDSTEASYLDMEEHGLVSRNEKLLQSVLNMRNAFAHEHYRGMWAEFCAHYRAIVESFLEVLHWCTEYPLLRAESGGEVSHIMGSLPEFPKRSIVGTGGNLTAFLPANGFTPLLLGNPELTRFLPLQPFIVCADCTYCEREPVHSMRQEVFLFNGIKRKQPPRYVGLRHSPSLSALRDQVEQVFAAKEVPPKVSPIRELRRPSTFIQPAFRQSERWLSESIRLRRYIPELYHPRREIEHALETFAASSATGFLLLGEAGIGKTFLVCRKVEECRENGELVLFYNGQQISSDHTLEEIVLGDLALSGDFNELADFLRREGKRLWVMIDGVNESPHAAVLLERICAFVGRYVPESDGEMQPIKVVLSFRTTQFRKALNTLLAAGGTEDAYFSPRVFHARTIEKHGRTVESVRFELEPMREAELHDLYESYRAHEGRLDASGMVVRSRPLTPFAALSPAIRQLLSNPWYLRAITDVFDGREIPEALWSGDVVAQLCVAKIDGKFAEERDRYAGRSELVRSLVSLLRERKETFVWRYELPALLPLRHGSSLLEGEITRSP